MVGWLQLLSTALPPGGGCSGVVSPSSPCEDQYSLTSLPIAQVLESSALTASLLRTPGLGQGKPGYVHRLGGEPERSPEEKGLRKS